MLGCVRLDLAGQVVSNVGLVFALNEFFIVLLRSRYISPQFQYFFLHLRHGFVLFSCLIHFHTAVGDDRPSPDDPYRKYESLYREVGKDVAWGTRYLYADFNMFLLENANMMCDALSMAHSLESRPPFLQKDIVTYAFSLPFALKLAGFDNKHCLKEAYAGRLPAHVLKKRKEGLVVPYPSLFSGELKEYVRDMLGPRRVADTGIFSPAAVTDVLERHFKRQQNNAFVILVLLYFQIWHDIFIKRGV